jgi:hypothetical protein
LFHDFINGFFGGRSTNIGARTSAKATGNVRAQLDATISTRLGQSLSIGIRNDEVDAFQLRLDHVVDTITASASDAKDSNTRP